MDALKPLISIIVPVYKVEPYLRKCVDSILAQTYTNIEVILIDDGSPDGCPAICDEYAEKDSRVVVIHQKNAGVSAARTAGLDVAKGEYIGFVDSDDWIEPEMYEAMEAVAEKQAAKLIACGIKYYEKYDLVKECSLTTVDDYNRKQLLEEIFGMPNRIGGGCCNKLFRADLIKDIRFDKDVAMAEDWLFLFQSLRMCERGIKIEDPFYCVFVRPGSATRSENVLISSKRLLTSSLLLLLLCREKEPWLEGQATVKYLDDCARYIPLIRKGGKENHQPYRMVIVQIKWIMLQYMARAWFKRLVPFRILSRYCYLWLKV